MPSLTRSSTMETSSLIRGLVLLLATSGYVTGLEDTREETYLPPDNGEDPPEYPEYCEAETFTASCQENEVILIRRALYGRMRSGRCVDRNYGYLGCSADVLSHMDWMCSGKRECEVRIPDATLDAVNQCPRDLKTYLEVDFECIEVVNPPCHACARSNNSAIVSGPVGHLASTTVTSGGCGTGQCPWLIKETEGRRINLTLYDFSVPEGRQHGLMTACDRLALVNEVDGVYDDHRVELCSGSGRETHVYTSQTSVVQVTVDASFLSNYVTDQRRFIIKYEAFGCPDMSPPANAWIQREGETLVVGCATGDTTYHLTCEGSRWTGTMGSCPQTVSTDEVTNDAAPHSQPVGIMVATAVGIALIIGSLVLTIGLVYVRRRGLTRPPPHSPAPCPAFPQTPDPRLVIMSKVGTYCSPSCQKACYQAILTSKQHPGDYEYAMEMRPLPDAPLDPTCYDVRRCTASSPYSRQVSRTSSIAGVHCNPAFQRLTGPPSEHLYHREGPPRLCRHYFELEPDEVNTVLVNPDPKPPVSVPQGAGPGGPHHGNNKASNHKDSNSKPRDSTEERQNKTNRGKEFTRQGSYHGQLLTTFGKRASDSATEDLIESEGNSSKFSWP